ncbi:organic cation transporter protein-like [Mercenaria mercenaria]|uniref:organic cation transporter protein-like n=1 Tax=Mercenaria mercenaria TaxID=6596 RepID=UPI00234EF216|nr:organic cation transporter protein-like [Mercenaria mercenaria]
MVGVLFGCLFSSYLADYIGPKRTFFSGQLTVIIFNFVGIYSTYAELYILIRILIGLGIGLSVTVQFALMIEYVPAKLVPVVSAVPSVSIGGCLFAPVVWWLHDWKMFHLFITVAGLPSLLLFWCVPDSFRWQMIKYKQATAARTYRMIAWVNRKEKPDVNDLLTDCFRARGL